MEERRIPVTSEVDKKIREVAELLQGVGLGAFADAYYEADDYDCPYFKVEKDFLREGEGDPEKENIFLDVTHEFTVHGRYGHDHFNSAADAVALLHGLYTGEIAEAAVCFPDITARFFVRNTGNHEENLRVFSDEKHAGYIMDMINKVVPMMVEDAHVHIVFSASAPYYLQILRRNNQMYHGCRLYTVSAVIGAHSEYYLQQ